MDARKSDDSYKSGLTCAFYLVADSESKEKVFDQVSKS